MKNGGFGEFSVANNSGVTKIFFGSGNHAYVDGINFGFKTTSPNSEVHVIGGICVESSDSNCSSPNGTVMVSVGLDAVGAVDMDYGSGDVTDHRFITDGTGNSEMVLPNDSIGPAEIDSTTGIYDFGDVTSLEIPNGSGPNVSVEGQIEITTDAYTSTGSSGTITFFSNGRIHYVVTTTGPPSDNSIAKWDSALNQWSIEADAGGGGDDTNSIRTITWAGPTLLATRPQQTGFDGIAGNFQNDGSSISVQSAAFDDSDDECRGTTFDVQRDTDTTGTVTFDVVWYSTTATSGSVQWFFSWVNYAEGESWDQLLTQESAASDAVQGTVNQVTRTSWTETMSNLGWEAGDAITGFICRDGDGSAGTDDMVDDAQILTFTIGIPRQ
ncbi:MAG: hypothetical protein IID49_02500 [Proteobacteria bacterium]|nr:hypothetical protein [Pseudomonadota bacterium]